MPAHLHGSQNSPNQTERGIKLELQMSEEEEEAKEKKKKNDKGNELPP